MSRSKNKKKQYFSNTPVVSKTEKTPVYPTIELKEKGKLILPAEVLAQITFLHASIGKTEWSGVLFYDVKSGNPSEPKDFKLEAKYIYLMDIGSAAYTEYEPDEDLIEMYDKFEDAIEWKTGHVHTHHDMTAYFSGTDTSELNDNVDKYNYYLSLIVNFDGEYVAKVAFLSDVKTISTMDYVDDDGVKQMSKTETVEKSMVTVDMQILYGADSFTADRVKDVRKKIEEAKKAKTSYPMGFRGGYGYPSGYGKGFDEHDYPPYTGGYKYGGYGPSNVNSKSDSPDPKNLTNSEVEKLTRNIIAVNPELREVRAVYSVLSGLVEENKLGDLDFYYTFLENNIDEILESFFEGPLDYEDLVVVIDEVIKSVQRFSGHMALKGAVAGIVEVLTAYVEIEKMNEEDDDDNDDKEMDKKVLQLNAKK